jgi:hypothetical protein
MIQLNTDMNVLNEITQNIAKNKTERSAFMRNPNAYTKMYGLEISNSNTFRATEQPKTSQITIALLACLVGLYVAAATIAAAWLAAYASMAVGTHMATYGYNLPDNSVMTNFDHIV